MSESQAVARSPIDANPMKEKALLVVMPLLITAIVVTALLLFSVNWVQVAIAVIPVALVLYVAVSQISAKLIRPASELATQTRSLADGDLSHIVSLPDEGEFGAIASNINHIVRDLRAARERASQFQVLEESAGRSKSASDELRLSYDNLIVVSELGQQIIASLRLEDIASKAYETLNTMMDAATLELATIEPGSQSLRIILSIDRAALNPPYTIPLDSPSSFGAWTAVHRREVFLEDVETNYARYTRKLESLSPGMDRNLSVISVPMFTQGAVVGVMQVGSYRKSAFSAYHLDMLKSLALYIAVALDNAQAYQKLDRALTELKTAQRQLVQAEKMSSLGLLTAGIAHEINNPINFVSANVNPLRRNLNEVLEILARYDKLDEKQHIASDIQAIRQQEAKIDLAYTVREISKLLDGIQEGASRTAEIVQGLRNFSRTDEQSIKIADLHQGIDSTLTLLHNKYKEHVEIVKYYGDIPEIECFAGQLNQVFMNILSNAIQAILENTSTSGNGKIWIRTKKKDNSTIEIHFKDSGTGMPEEVRKQIFDPFFTTKDVGVGTGLGLSISYGIIEKHGGHIAVESKPGHGTEFIITLPVKQSVHG